MVYIDVCIDTLLVFDIWYVCAVFDRSGIDRSIGVNIMVKMKVQVITRWYTACFNAMDFQRFVKHEFLGLAERYGWVRILTCFKETPC